MFGFTMKSVNHRLESFRTSVRAVPFEFKRELESDPLGFVDRHPRDRVRVRIRSLV